MKLTQIMKTYGIDPNSIGFNRLGFYVVNDENTPIKSRIVKNGLLCIKTRDWTKSTKHFDVKVLKIKNFVGYSLDKEEGFLFYYFKPVDRENKE